MVSYLLVSLGYGTLWQRIVPIWRQKPEVRHFETNSLLVCLPPDWIISFRESGSCLYIFFSQYPAQLLCTGWTQTCNEGMNAYKTRAYVLTTASPYQRLFEVLGETVGKGLSWDPPSRRWSPVFVTK